MTNSVSDSWEKGDGGSLPPEFLAEMIAIAHSVSDIYETIIASVEPQVIRVIATNCQDVAVIEQLLDQLLDVCDDKQALNLFRNLCRHYWPISPTNTAIYIDAYRSMWDTNDTAEANHEPA